MKFTAEQFVESLARLSDEEKQKAANLLVSKWKYLTKSFMGMVDAEMQDQFMTEQADISEIQKSVENGATIKEILDNRELI